MLLHVRKQLPCKSGLQVDYQSSANVSILAKSMSSMQLIHAAHWEEGCQVVLCLPGMLCLSGRTVGRESVQVHIDQTCLWSTTAQNAVLS